MVRKDMWSHKSTMRDWSANVGHLLSLILKTRDIHILLKPVNRYENLVMRMIGVGNRWNLVDHTTFVTMMIAATRIRVGGQREAHIMMIVVDFRIRNLNHAELVVVMVLCPWLLTSLQFWIFDYLLKAKDSAADGSDDGVDGVDGKGGLPYTELAEETTRPPG